MTIALAYGETASHDVLPIQRVRRESTGPRKLG